MPVTDNEWLLWNKRTREFTAEITLRNGDKVAPDTAKWEISIQLAHAPDGVSDFVTPNNVASGVEGVLECTATIVKNNKKYTFKQKAKIDVIDEPGNPLATDVTGVALTVGSPV